MIASDNSSTGTRVPQIEIGAKENFPLFGILIRGYAGGRDLKEVLFKEIPADETAAQKTKRQTDFNVKNQQAYAILLEACSRNEIALGVVLNHATTDPDLWAKIYSKY